jgi:hypothetical protein
VQWTECHEYLLGLDQNSGISTLSQRVLLR